MARLTYVRRVSRFSTSKQGQEHCSGYLIHSLDNERRIVVRLQWKGRVTLQKMEPTTRRERAARKKRAQLVRKKREQLARQWLTTANIERDDSDDELGEEDLPWEWIYDVDDDESQGRILDDEEIQTPTRRRGPRKKRIVGARTGPFECRLGQTVLLKSPEEGKDWAGIICEFLEEEDEDEDEMVKSANIMWFVSPQEFMSTKHKKRTDALPNEQYITKDFNVNPLSAINGKARVMSKDAFYTRYPDGIPPKAAAERAEFNKCIICRRGVNQLQGKYTEEFVWEDIHSEGMQGVLELIDRIRSELKTSKKRKQVDVDVSSLCTCRVISILMPCSTSMSRMKGLLRPLRRKGKRPSRLRVLLSRNAVKIYCLLLPIRGMHGILMSFILSRSNMDATQDYG